MYFKRKIKLSICNNLKFVTIMNVYNIRKGKSVNKYKII
jgi:hypothetical protein